MIIKKIYIGIFAAGMLLAAACSNDDLEATGNEAEAEAQAGEEVTVSFSLGLDGGASTRAISDGSVINKIYYAILNSDKTSITDGGVASADVDFSTSSTASINADLVNGQTYTAVFWAQNSSCTAYKVDTIYSNSYAWRRSMYVDISYDGATNNDETRDAFYAAKEFTASSSSPVTVTLTRPFAQINVGVPESDWEAAVDAGITIAQSSVTIQSAATYMNLLTGEIPVWNSSAQTNNVTATFSSAAIPSDDDEYLTIDGSTDKYKWLSMAYILPPYGQTTLNALDFTFSTGETVSDTDITLNLTDLAVGANYRTNILGSFLSGSASSTSTDISTEAGLIAAAANSGTIIDNR